MHIRVPDNLDKHNLAEYGNRTWAYKLYRKAMSDTKYNKSNDPKNMLIRVRGPYGAAFSSCFGTVTYQNEDANKTVVSVTELAHRGVMVIGAGSGLTAAESVLRHFLYHSDSRPSILWFVYQCKKAGDLLWCYKTLLRVIYEAAGDGKLRETVLGDDPARVTVFDW